MRLALVTRRFWPLIGEPEFAAANLAETFFQLGHDVNVLTGRSFPGWPAEFLFRGYQVTRLPQKFPTFRIRRQFEKSVLRNLRDHQQETDCVLFFQAGRPPFELVDKVAKLGLKCLVRLEPSVVFNEQIASSEIAAVVAGINSIHDPSRCTWVTHSRLLAKQFEQHSIPIHVAPDGIAINALEELEADERLTAQNRKKLAKTDLSRSHPMLRIRPTEKLIVFAGQIAPSQHLHKWIASMKTIRKSLRGAKLWIIGEGNIQQQLWDQIIDLGLDDRVVMGGVFDDLSSVFDAADALILSDPMRIEAPFTLLAQSRELPVVTNFEADFPLTGQELSGLIESATTTNIEARTSDELGASLVQVLNGAIPSNKIVESARLKIVNSHTMGLSATAYLDLVLSLK